MTMPWLKTNPMFERHHCAQDLASGVWTLTEWCARYGISRNTGYQWRERFLVSGIAGLAEHSCALLSSAGETSEATVALILAEHARYGWGARKILKRRQTKDPTAEWPARRTIVDILARNGCVRRRRSRTHGMHPGAAHYSRPRPIRGGPST
jgi:putative transposase